MKKIIIALLVLMMFVPISIYADDDVIHLNTNPIDSSLSLNDYVIYHEGDLTLSIDIDTNITGNNGIYVDGDLTIVGENILTIDVTGIGIDVTGSFTVLNPLINVSGQVRAYAGNQIKDNDYVLDSSGNMAYFFDESYYDYDLNNVLTSLIIKPKEYADISKIDKSHTTIYKRIGDEVLSYSCKEGFIINESEDVRSVTYNEDLLTYYVNIWKDFDENNKATNFIEFLFDKSEWGKTLDYEVIEAKNFYEDYELENEYVIDHNRHPMNLVGVDKYSYLDDANSIDAISDFMLFITNNKDNKIVLKIYGKDDEYRYINLVVNDNDDKDDKEDKKEEKEYYHVVNTGAEETLPKSGELSGAYTLDSNIKTLVGYEIVGETSINLNGYTITYINNSEPLFVVNNNLTINGEESSIVLNKDSTLFKMNGDYTVNISGGSYESKSDSCSRALINIDYGSLNIENVDLSSANTSGIYFMGDNLSITNTSIKTKDGGIVINNTKANTKLKNVDIETEEDALINNGTIKVESGKYSFDPSGYIDDKYVIGKNEEDKFIVGYSVCFNLDNGSDNKIIYVIENDKVEKIEDPIKEGCEFVSWLFKEIEFDFDTPIIESIELVAKYNKMSARINDTYYSDLISAIELSKENDEIVLLKDISDIDYIELKPGVSLDLNGNIIEVNSFNSWGLVKDSLKTGKLKVKKDNFNYFGGMEVRPSDINTLPLYVGDGYIFSSLDYIGQEWKYGLNDAYNPKYRFQPHAIDIDKILADTNVSDIGVFVEVVYRKGDSIDNKVIEFSDVYLKDFLINPLNTVMYVSLSNTEGVDNIKARSYIKSKSANLIVSNNYIETTKNN